MEDNVSQSKVSKWNRSPIVLPEKSLNYSYESENFFEENIFSDFDFVFKQKKTEKKLIFKGPGCFVK